MLNKFEKVCSYFDLDDFSLKNLRKGDLLRYKHSDEIVEKFGLEPEGWTFGVFVGSVWYIKTDWAYKETSGTESKPPEIGVVYDLEVIELNSSQIIHVTTTEYDVERLVKTE